MPAAGFRAVGSGLDKPSQVPRAGDRTMRLRESSMFAKRLIANHCLLLVFACIIFRALERYRESYPINCAILLVWLLALAITAVHAGVTLLNHQVAEKIDPVALMEEAVEDVYDYQFFDNLFIASNFENQKTKSRTIAAAGTFSLALSLFMIGSEYHFHVRELYFEPQISNVRTSIFCWWMYTTFSGLKFGGFHVTERQHRYMSVDSFFNLTVFSLTKCEQYGRYPAILLRHHFRHRKGARQQQRKIPTLPFSRVSERAKMSQDVTYYAQN